MKKQWIHRARKQDSYKYDIDDKDKINRLLKREFGFSGITDEGIGTVTDHKFPDIYVRHRDLVIELDGEYHGNGDPISTSAKDFERYAWYKKHGLNLIVINKNDTDGYDEDLVIARLETCGLKRLI